MPDPIKLPIVASHMSAHPDPMHIAFVHRVATAVPDILYVYDVREGRNIYCNREIAAVLGYSPQEVLDFGTELFARLLHPDDTNAIADGHDKLASAGDGTVVEVSYRMCHNDGSWHWLRSRDTVFARDSDGNVVQKLGVAHDVTAERQAKQELAESEARYRSLVSVLSDWVWVIDTQNTYTYVSQRVSELLGYSPSEMLGRTAIEFMFPDESKRVETEFSEITAKRSAFHALKHSMACRNGTPLFMEASGTPMFHPETGEWVGYSGVNRDITAQHYLDQEREAYAVERESLLAMTRQRAEEDPLTGLRNRTAFENALTRYASAAVAQAEETPALFAILLLDLDNLKFFNDTYGHAAGDDVLVFIAGAIRSCCGPQDVIARRGGDEFAVLLPGADRTGADARLNLIKNAVSRAGYKPPQRIGSTAESIPITLGISGGSAIMTEDGSTASAVFEAADERLYLDKTNAQITWSESLKANLSENLPGFASLDALVTSVAAKDRYTLRHSEDVVIYADLIANGLELPSSDLRALTVAALLHDVGKIGVPDRLLRLPGPLTPEEHQTVRLHAALGAALAASAAPEIASQMPTVVSAIRHHHERWDGGEGGYPDRLAGEAIPFHARILAVADALSAMTTDRPYRKGLAIGDAINRLSAGSGTQWDSRCVDAVIVALESKAAREISRR